MQYLLSNRELLARLVGFDSSSANSNRPIADFICDYLDLPGVSIARQPSPDGDKVNLVVTVGTTEQSNGRGLVLSGHMDTVPADEPEWRTDPYTMTESDGHYFGRGVCDMKGFLALAINAAASCARSNLEHPLVLVFTYDEELGIVGAKHLSHAYEGRERLPTAAIIGEPTSLRVVRMHKGYLAFEVVIAGKSAHSGYPHLGVNAIEPAGRLIGALTEMRREMEGESPPNSEYFPDVPYVALNIGTISGGTAANIVPDRCAVACTARLLPGMDTSSMIERIREVVDRALNGSEFHLAITNQTPPMLLDQESKIYEMLTAQVGQTTTHSASYATDAGWLQRIGMECAIFGPGNIEVAHRPNESLPIDDFVKCEEVLDRTVLHCCGGNR